MTGIAGCVVAFAEWMDSGRGKMVFWERCLICGGIFFLEVGNWLFYKDRGRIA